MAAALRLTHELMTAPAGDAVDQAALQHDEENDCRCSNQCRGQSNL
jgi:hypothetical protein